MNTKQIIIDIMARYNDNKISKQVFVILFDAVLKEDMEYIARAGYELIDHYEEKPRFDFLEIQACFTLFSELDKPDNKYVLIYCFTLFGFYFEHKWRKFKSRHNAMKSVEEMETFKGDYICEGYILFVKLFLYSIKKHWAPQSFFYYFDKTIDKKLSEKMRKEHFASYGIDKNTNGPLLSLEAEIEGTDGLTLADIVADRNDSIHQFEEKYNIMQTLEKLPKTQQNVAIMRLGLYAQGVMTYKSIGEALGMHEKTVSREFQRAVIKMRDLQ